MNEEEKEIKTESTDKIKLSFIVWQVVGYVGFILILLWTLNGGAGAIVKYLLAQGIEWIEMSTFGTAIIGLGMLITWAAIKRAIDKIFERLFNITTKNPKKR